MILPRAYQGLQLLLEAIDQAGHKGKILMLGVNIRIRGFLLKFAGSVSKELKVSTELIKWSVNWFIIYLRDLQPTFTGVIIHLLSNMGIPVLLVYCSYC